MTSRPSAGLRWSCLQPAVPEHCGRRVLGPERQSRRRHQECGGAHNPEGGPHRLARRRNNRTGDPGRNYAQFLLRALLPVVVHVVVALAAGYSVGSEFRRRSMRTWLRCAGGNPMVALVGKLAPLFAIFFFIMSSVPLILEGVFQLSFKGDVPMIIAAGSLMVIANLALGALLQPLVRDLPTGLGLTGLIVSPAFGFAGVGFPILAMNMFR